MPPPSIERVRHEDLPLQILIPNPDSGCKWHVTKKCEVPGSCRSENQSKMNSKHPVIVKDHCLPHGPASSSTRRPGYFGKDACPTLRGTRSTRKATVHRIRRRL